MDRMQEYVVNSLEQHLFFARIMKEHAFFLKVGLMPPRDDLAQEGERLLRQFESLLSRAISLSNNVVRSRVVNSGELVTEFTDRAECHTGILTGTSLERELTARTKQLRGRGRNERLNVSQVTVRRVRQLNRDAISAVKCIIDYKERLLNCVKTGSIFTVNYPLLIEHILREARLYRSYLMQLEGMQDIGCQELRNRELFWNQIMMEHAQFIRGLLDPTEEELMKTADCFARDYQCLLETAGNAQDRMMHSGNALELTKKFRDFKCAGVEGIEACKIRSLILPLLADHVLREANHYIRLLEE